MTMPRVAKLSKGRPSLSGEMMPMRVLLGSMFMVVLPVVLAVNASAVAGGAGFYRAIAIRGKRTRVGCDVGWLVGPL